MSVELRGVTWEHERGHDSIVAAGAEYASHRPEVSFRWDARSLQSFADQPLEQLAGQYDLLVIDHPHVAGAAAAGLLEPLDDRLPPALDDGAFIGRSHASYRYRGRQYGLATDAAAQVSAHRPDLLDSPPETWSQVLELAAEGRVLWPAKPIDAFSSLVTVIAQGGGGVMTQEGVFARHEDVDRAWGLLSALATSVPPRCLSMNPIEVAEELSSGTRFAYSPLLFGYTNYSRPGYRGNLLHYRDIPVAREGDVPRGSLLGGAGVAVSASSAQKEEAIRFAVWLAGSEAQRGSYFDAGGQPGHSDAWNDGGLDAAASGFFSGTRRTLENATVRPAHPRFIAFQDAASIVVTEALADRASAASVTEALNTLFAGLREEDLGPPGGGSGLPGGESEGENRADR